MERTGRELDNCIDSLELKLQLKHLYHQGGLQSLTPQQETHSTLV